MLESKEINGLNHAIVFGLNDNDNETKLIGLQVCRIHVFLCFTESHLSIYFWVVINH